MKRKWHNIEIIEMKKMINNEKKMKEIIMKMKIIIIIEEIIEIMAKERKNNKMWNEK